MEIKNEYGFLYPLYSRIIELFKKVNLVEGFKKFYLKFISKPKSSIELLNRDKRIATDIFIVFKFSVILVLWILNCKDICSAIFVWYLIATNLFTYFYYHIWDKESAEKVLDWDSIKRRFFNLILAIIFSEIAFAFLYSHYYINDFQFSQDTSYVLQSIWFSISNSLAANYEKVEIFTSTGNSIAMVQLLITFAFITIILGNSIPERQEKGEEIK